MRHRPIQPGFTLIEMLMVVAITAVIMLALSMIFTNVVSAIGQGIGASSVMNTARAMSTTIYNDGDNMLSPRDGGFLVIRQRTVDDVRIAADDAAEFDVRSDELMFIRSRGVLTPVTPRSFDTLAPYPSTAAFVRIWYGHIDRMIGVQRVRLEENRATDWDFGRHALFLEGDFTAGDPGTPERYVSSTGGIAYNSALAGDIGDVPEFGSPKLSSGMVDIAQTALADVLDDLENASDYADEAESYLLGKQGSDNESRLVTRRFPLDTTEQVPDPEELSVGRMSQMHTHLAPYVGEVLVEFAADTNMDGLVDVVDTGDQADQGRVKWYGLGQDTNFDGAVNATDLASWPDASSGGPTYDPAARQNASDHLYVWRHGDVGTNSGWPYMVRIRYRIGDRQGAITGPDGLPGRPLEQIIYVQRD